MDNMNNCRVCGYYMEDAPWGDDGQSPTYEICPCCGVEFGNEDYTLESTIEYRNKWLSEKVTFYESKVKPQDWNFQNQMENIPKDYK